ncbi:hypothetical protein HNY73_022820 [Argiope bruennichi]|uniref:Uncharacterized protein n=1 Tax=Argiope bruennichi TaxID=94029 RepID=A0A8T0E6D4_ARGBR|nr:hypothetical protein HNY73_022820 [Argiope bruennichi]
MPKKDGGCPPLPCCVSRALFVLRVITAVVIHDHFTPHLSAYPIPQLFINRETDRFWCGVEQAERGIPIPSEFASVLFIGSEISMNAGTEEEGSGVWMVDCDAF